MLAWLPAAVCVHVLSQALELGLVSGASQRVENAGSGSNAGEADASRGCGAGEGQEVDDEGATDAQAFKRRKAAAAHRSATGSSARPAAPGSAAASAAPAESKSADTASHDDITIDRRGSLIRPSVVPTWLASLFGSGGPDRAGLAIPSSGTASSDQSWSSQSSSASRKRKSEHSSPVAAAAAAVSPCPFSAIDASVTHRTGGHTALPPGAVSPPPQLRVSNVDLLIAMMDLERYKDLLFAGQHRSGERGEWRQIGSAIQCSAVAAASTSMQSMLPDSAF